MKRITINVTPADNGYVVNGNASDANGQNPVNCNKVATTSSEVATQVAEFVKLAFAPPTPPKQQ